MPTTRVTGRGPKSPVDEEFLKQLYQGGELLAQGLLTEARLLLERAHQLQPRNEKGRNLLGLAYFKLGHFERAAEVYEALVRDNPVDATLRVNLGLVYLKTNALQRAMREFEAATDLQPDHKKAHNYLGLALAQAKEYGRAREHFLLSGSDVLAEKMARAIAGETLPKPARPPPVAPAPMPRAAPPGEGQWGAQFGLDEVPPGPRPAESSEEELRFDEDEDEEEEAARAESPPPAKAPSEVTLEEGAAPELPVRAASPRPARDIPMLTDLTPALALAGASPAHRFRLGPGSFSVFVEGELLTRLEGLVAFSGQLEFEPERKRFRGRATDEPFGVGPGRFTRVSGRGVLFLESAEAHSFLAVDLGDSGVYVREECVFAFEEVVAFENGKMPSTAAPDLDLVYLRGQGRVVLAFRGALRSVVVAPELPVTVPASHLVGWQGQVTPEVVSLPGEHSPSRVAVQLSGEGFALITLPVR
ncbi:tetratricopeptide repeat protein [Melittangium boletus]|uniref:Cell envelope integrity/translocation protein TolA n=1 Tax=Melittangium boletus DSM 14713 TaxID=1294270 RepID=A0A250ITH7_9BACT|nr:tetratricopeptide repeat protein [Melittangium boletus]ATB34487.1 cell envelope integrity/translocation protein TolA [Melittangium boletus DSM 14713]